jgi:hypothetical protein
MAKFVRYASYLRELGSQQRWIGIPSPGDVPRWLHLVKEPGWAILWVAAILVLFDMLILRAAPTGGWRAAAGLAGLVAGVVLLRDGLRAGLVPFCDTFARALAARSPLTVVIGVGLVLGVLLPFIEPVFGALSAGSAHLDVRTDPYLHAILRQHPATLLAVLMAATGTAVALGLVRIVRGWPLRPLIMVTLVPALGLTGHQLFDPELARVPALAWDCGALIGGPATAILMLAFGIGTAGAAGSSRAPLPGFGIVALSTIVPALAVLVYAMVLAETTGVEEILAATTVARQAHPAWLLLFGVPLMLGAVLVAMYMPLRFVLEQPLPRPRALLLNLAWCLAGLVLVSAGVRSGLAPLVEQAAGGLAGLIVPSPEAVTTATSDWPMVADLILAAAFAGVIARQAALAEPALAVFSGIADAETHGVLRGTRLVRTAAGGAAAGAFSGVLALACGFPVAGLIVAGWLIALVLATVAGEDIAGTAWDGAAMMTGPLTLAVLAAIGAGLSRVPWVDTGFGLPAASLLGAALAVLIDGAGSRLLIRRRAMLRNSGFVIP